MKPSKTLSTMLILAATLTAGALSVSTAMACEDYGCGGGVYQQVLVRPAQTIAHLVPARYQSMAETYIAEPARSVAHTVPPIYRTVSERVMVEPAREVAEPIAPIRQTIAEHVPVRVSSGCGCVRTVYQTRYRTVEVRPASVAYRQIPAVYSSQSRTIEVRPAQTVYETVAAVYGQRTRTVEVEPARTEYETIPAEYRTVYRQVYQAPRPVYTGCGCQSDY